MGGGGELIRWRSNRRDVEVREDVGWRAGGGRDVDSNHGTTKFRLWNGRSTGREWEEGDESLGSTLGQRGIGTGSTVALQLERGGGVGRDFVARYMKFHELIRIRLCAMRGGGGGGGGEGVWATVGMQKAAEGFFYFF